MKRCTLFLDQGEMLGGAERFLLDFFLKISSTETNRLHPIIVGAKSEEYRTALPARIETRFFNWPSVRGNKIKAIFNLFSAARKLKQLTKTENATQVFANTPRTMFVAYLAKKFLRMPVKMIVMIHDFTIPASLLRHILCTADTIVVNSIPTRKYVLEQLSKEHYKKIRIVENGVDFSRIPNTDPVTKISKVLMIGRIDPRKGQKFAVEAAIKLPELQFRIVGSPFPNDQRTLDYDCEIREIVHSNKLKNVSFISEVSDPFIEMARADIVLALPTEPETFGRIVTEALACGRPVVAFDRTGPRDILRQFEGAEKLSSLRVELNSTESLVEKLKDLLSHPNEVKKIAKVARRFVEKNYPLSETAKRLIHVLSE
jgi:glycosyltransferase involved in cell wall biosynthesis